MRTIEEALEAILTPVAPLEAAREPLAAAVGRVAAEDVPAAVDLPPFDRSAMDGYAVRAADLAPGTAAPVSTGAALPPGADAVLQSELAEIGAGTVTPERAIEPGRHVRYRGEDVHAGDVLARAGERLTLPRLSALASAGVGEVAVHRRPRLHLLVTGSELLPLGAPPEPGRIHESNGLMVSLLARRAGAEVIGGDVVPDDRAATLEAVERGLADDVLVVSGGVSVGPHDHVKPAFEAGGVEEVLWRVRIKPGKPMWFGRRGPTLVFGLPGNPLSSIVCFCVFIEPALRRLQGERDARPRLVRGRIAAPAEASDGRTTFLTAAIAAAEDGVLEATPTERQGSHMTGALGESDGFAIAPHGAPALRAGDPVDLLLLG